MSGFWYFLPNMTADRLVADRADKQLDREVLAQRGLDAVLADVETAETQVVVSGVARAGPGEYAGVLLYPLPNSGEVPNLVQYRPDRQAWTPIGDGSRCWIGLDPASLPEPEDLARRETVAGYLVNDAHGRQWSVPIARSPREGGVSLPCDYRFDGAGRAVRQLKAEFDDLWQIAGKVWDFYNNTDDPPAEVNDLWLAERAVRILSLNYRLGPAELDRLCSHGRGVLDTGTLTRIFMALIDWDIARRVKKKGTPDDCPSTPGPSSSTPGEPAAEADTDRAGES